MEEKPLYRVRVDQVDETFVCIPGDRRGILYPDVEGAFPTLDAFKAYHSLGFGLGDGALPILDMVSVTVGERLYETFDAYLDARDKADPCGSIEERSAKAFWHAQRLIFSTKARHREEVWHIPTRLVGGRGREVTLWNPETGEEKTVLSASIVDITDNYNTQILHQGEVCLYVWGAIQTRSGHRTPTPVDSIERCADKPVGPRVTYRGRHCHYKWKCRQYALIYDPKIGADRKVSFKSLTWIDPKPEAL